MHQKDIHTHTHTHYTTKLVVDILQNKTITDFIFPIFL